MRRKWLIPISVFIFTCSLVAENGTAPKLSIHYGGSTYPVVRFEDQNPVIELENGKRVTATGDWHLHLEGDAQPSLGLGYSPALYEVQRSQADHARAASGGPLHVYNAATSSAQKKNRNSFWNDVPLNRLWSKEAIELEGAVWIGAWYTGTFDRVEARNLSSGWTSFNFMLRESQLSGRPILMLWHEGDWIPPTQYYKATENSPFHELQKGHVPTTSDQILETDPLGLTWLDYACAWGLFDSSNTAALAPETVAKLEQAKMSPIVYAALHGHSDTVRHLLGLGFSPNQNMRALGFDLGQLAVFTGHTTVLEELLKHDYDPSKKSSVGGYSAYTLAIDFGRDDIVKIFREMGIERPKASRSKTAKLVLRDAHAGHANLLQLWLENDKIDPNKHSGEWTPLALAVISENPHAVKVLLEAGADPNAKVPTHPLLISTSYENGAITRLLLDAGANPNAQAPDGDTPLRNAIILGNEDSVSRLLAAGADPNPPARNEIGIAEIATIKGEGKILRDLLAAGTICKLRPDLAEDILVSAIRNDLVEMAILAYEQCVNPDFALYDAFSLSWVAAYYDAPAIKQWWTDQLDFAENPAPVIVPWGALDAAPTVLNTSFPGYNLKRQAKYGSFTANIDVMIDRQGRVLFPRFESTFPKELIFETQANLALWRFTPPMKDGASVTSQVTIPLRFELPPPEEIFEAQDVTALPVARRQQTPAFPAELARSGIGGRLLLEFVITKEGRPTQIKIVRSTHPFFSRTTIEAVKNWRFEPGKINGQPVNMRVLQPITLRFN